MVPSVGLLMALTTLSSPDGVDANAAPARLIVSAPDRCLTREDLVRRVKARAPHVTFAEDAPLVARVAVTAYARDAQTVELDFTRPGQAGTPRVLETRTCAQAADAVALILAVTLDPAAQAASPNRGVDEPATPPAGSSPTPAPSAGGAATAGAATDRPTPVTPRAPEARGPPSSPGRPPTLASGSPPAPRPAETPPAAAPYPVAADAHAGRAAPGPAPALAVAVDALRVDAGVALQPRDDVARELHVVDLVLLGVRAAVARVPRVVAGLRLGRIRVHGDAAHAVALGFPAGRALLLAARAPERMEVEDDRGRRAAGVARRHVNDERAGLAARHDALVVIPGLERDRRRAGRRAVGAAPGRAAARTREPRPGGPPGALAAASAAGRRTAAAGRRAPGRGRAPATRARRAAAPRARRAAAPRVAAARAARAGARAATARLAARSGRGAAAAGRGAPATRPRAPAAGAAPAAAGGAAPGARVAPGGRATPDQHQRREGGDQPRGAGKTRVLHR